MSQFDERKYYVKIGNCKFNGNKINNLPSPLDKTPTPIMKREGFKILPKLVIVTDDKRTASGKLYVKPLAHRPTKMELSFPIMTPDQYRIIKRAFRGQLTDEPEMKLTVEYYDEDTDSYKKGTFYHTDISYSPIIYGGKRMLQVDTIKLIEW